MLFKSSRRPILYLVLLRTVNKPSLYADARLPDLSVVGKISGMYKQTIANAAEIPNFPIMLNASDRFPVQKTQNVLNVCRSTDKHEHRARWE